MGFRAEWKRPSDKTRFGPRVVQAEVSKRGEMSGEERKKQTSAKLADHWVSGNSLHPGCRKATFVVAKTVARTRGENERVFGVFWSPRRQHEHTGGLLKVSGTDFQNRSCDKNNSSTNVTQRRPEQQKLQPLACLGIFGYFSLIGSSRTSSSSPPSPPLSLLPPSSLSP